MACFGGYDEDIKEVGSCIHCQGPVDEDGQSTDYCSYSPVQCEVCDSRPCEQVITRKESYESSKLPSRIKD